MKTLKELIDEHGFNIETKQYDWGNMRFIPMYVHQGCIYGHFHDGSCARYSEKGCPEWQLYTEPKSKVMRAPYLVEGISARPELTYSLYKDDADFLEQYKFSETCKFKYKRLDNLEVECDT